MTREQARREIDSLDFYLQNHTNDYGEESHTAMMMAIDALSSLENPKMGHWIYTGDYITDGMLKCSECGFEHDVSDRFSYCPNCGANMSEIPTVAEGSEEE